MRIHDFQNACVFAVKAGAVIALAPVCVTALIAGSKIIAVNVIANIAVYILTGGTHRATVTGCELVHVPMLWKFSALSAATGGTIMAVALIALVASKVYENYSSSYT